MTECTSIGEVRENIDSIDREIVRLISERSRYVKQAARFKKNTDDVRAPKRVEEVIVKVRTLATGREIDPDIVEKVYRTMIACFIECEMNEHDKAQ
ncbi:MAG: chorismate mutase [Candidatus Methanoperedens sp.]|nr:chorismate mutase [Candidatus Methanoperedens sp.]